VAVEWVARAATAGSAAATAMAAVATAPGAVLVVVMGSAEEG
jgi:hypothetical protein